MENSDELNYLYDRYLVNEITPAETDIFFQLLAEDINDERFMQLLSQTWDQLKVSPGSQVIKTVAFPVVPMKGYSRRLFYRVAAAAAIIILLAAGYLLFFNRPSKPGIAINDKNNQKRDVAPGRDGAILKLSNGNLIVLDSAANGEVSVQGNSRVVKLDNGSVKYISGGKNSEASVVYNTLSTPRGRKYQLLLPDGTAVWLDAASSITYPTAFIGNERRVSITGQVYFEVTASPNPFKGGALRPFIVSKDDMQVEVLGTHFNVNAYDDEDVIKVTLLEGSVKVSQLTTHDSRLITPGQQAVITPNSQLTTQNSPDLEQVMAWKNELFDFKKADVKAVMRQISRWYDVDVVYEGKPSGTYSGGVSRNTNVSNVLKILELGGVHFEIEEKKIIVKP